MPLDTATQAELSYDPTDALRLELHGPSRRTTVVFTAVWCTGWLLTLASGVMQLIRLGRLDVSSVAWIIFWIAGGIPVLLALLWTAGGRREVLTIGGGCFTISRPAGPFRRTRSFDAHAVRNLHSTYALRPLFADGLAIREFWLAGAGPIVFDHDGRRYACGVALDTAAAARVASDLAALLPMATAHDGPAIGTSRVRTWAIAYVATAMLIPAVTVPLRLAITDRSICFCEDPAPLPLKPVNVSTMGRAGRIHFVPVDGYSPERARAIAAHFHRQFGIPVRVERGITTGTRAYDARRGQMNASVLLSDE